MQIVNSFGKIYDTYSPMVYSIALEFSPNQHKAEEILTATFTKLYFQDQIKSNSHNLCATLINLTLQIAKEKLEPEICFELKQFKNTPLLHKIFCENFSIKQICEQENLSNDVVAKKIRQELRTFRDFIKKSNSA